ncbi:helix-turn-helix domain-containing protein [Streptomyces kaempferi]
MGVDGASGPDEFGQLLVALRRGAGLSQEQLAHLAGISVRALADMERGRTRGPQRGTVQALCEALRVEPSAAGDLERAAAAGYRAVNVQAAARLATRSHSPATYMTSPLAAAPSTGCGPWWRPPRLRIRRSSLCAANPDSARPRSRCTPRTASHRSSRTGSSLSTCMAWTWS